MVVLVVHNHYQRPGGEDQVFDAETSLLEDRGHEVIRYTAHNDRVGEFGRLRLAGRTVWSREAHREIRRVIRDRRPRVMHVHNTFPLLSPAAYWAARAEGVAVVQTLHNYRIFCPNGLLFRSGRVCESCVKKAIPWPGVVHACYRDDRAATATVATMLGVHRALGTWKRAVSAYIALTGFSRDKFEEFGLPADRLHVKPNLLHPEPDAGEGGGDYALFVGRLSREKGVDCLLDALERLRGRVPCLVVGDGPLASRVAEAAEVVPGLQWRGQQPLPEIYRLMGRARVLVVPSQWYENFPRVVVESLARGTPVVVSRLGALEEIVDHERTGLLFRAGDPEDLARCLEWTATHDPELTAMRREARSEFEAKYAADRNYRLLMEIYDRAASTIE